MVSTFFGLETASRGLHANQDALSVVAQNVDNASTPGYSRQVANLTTTTPINLSYDGPPTTLIGTGVQVASITRDRNGFLDTQYRQQNAQVGQWTVDQDTLNQITGVINEPSNTGLSSALNTFWSDWSQLGSTPGNLSAADQLQQDAQTLTSTMNQTSQQLTQVANDLGATQSTTSQLATQMDQVNTYLTQIASVNQQISNADMSGSQPNDLMDQRDLLVDNLSNLVDVSTSDTNGVYTLTIGNNSSPAVTGSTVNQEMVFPGGTTSSPSLTAIDPSSVTGGQIKGIEDSLTTVNQYITNLDTFANQMATGSMSVQLDGDLQFPNPANGQMPFSVTIGGTTYPTGTPISTLGPTVSVDSTTGLVTVPSGTTVNVNGLNGLLQLGYSQSAQSTYPNTLQFFQAGNGAAPGAVITAANITVGVSADQIGYALRPQVSGSGSSTTFSAISGDGTLAMTASDMKSAQLTFTNAADPQMNMNGTLDQFLQAQVGQLGIQSQTANNQVKNQTSLLQQIDTQRQSVSGVDLNEEMSNMIQYQQGYNASAKMVSTIQDLFNTLMQAF
jgi:flagellar hook-associated protein 1